jgi:hypothetical protein
LPDRDTRSTVHYLREKVKYKPMCLLKIDQQDLSC